LVASRLPAFGRYAARAEEGQRRADKKEGCRLDKRSGQIAKIGDIIIKITFKI
jgi:hypothetical protein